MIRPLLIAGLALCAAACASTPAKKPLAERQGLTPTENYVVTVSASDDQILLAPHAEGLSAAQSAALSALVDRWHEAGGGPITVQAPSHGGGEAYRAASAVQGKLGALGVSETEIRLVGYAADARPGAPIVVGFTRYQAKGPVCGRNWESFTHSEDNTTNPNFGCSVTANIAAMVANPADLAQARPMDPADPERREGVLSKYRAGAVTSSAKDAQATGAISNAVP